jgi:hypothetical protein
MAPSCSTLPTYIIVIFRPKINKLTADTASLNTMQHYLNAESENAKHFENN